MSSSSRSQINVHKVKIARRSIKKIRETMENSLQFFFFFSDNCPETMNLNNVLI